MAETVMGFLVGEEGLEVFVGLQAGAADAIADPASRGLGVAVLSESMAASYGDRLTVRVIDDIETPVVLALIRKSTHNPAVRESVVHSRRAFTRVDPAQGLSPVR
ncbi:MULTISPECIES: LysR substrate-binding domain-containing protein [Streptomyces]|uniref:LysR substrate-binding domain-containing protein n=1 Tax=Streptomyces TaxID=1883 RepID=UPI001E305D6E|nr:MULTISPECIES: LysR substrate-binding domain-containing protein [Streptomyces]